MSTLARKAECEASMMPRPNRMARSTRVYLVALTLALGFLLRIVIAWGDSQ
jgi:hypothetical protein